MNPGFHRHGKDRPPLGRITLNSANEKVYLRQRKYRYLPLLFGILHVSLMSGLLIYEFYTKEGDKAYTQFIGSFLLGVLFIIQGIVTLRKAQELFVNFDEKGIRFRDQLKSKLRAIRYEEISSIEVHTYHAIFHLKNKIRLRLSWEEADYPQIKLLKEKLKLLNSSQDQPISF